MFLFVYNQGNCQLKVHLVSFQTIIRFRCNTTAIAVCQVYGRADAKAVFTLFVIYIYIYEATKANKKQDVQE